MFLRLTWTLNYEILKNLNLKTCLGNLSFVMLMSLLTNIAYNICFIVKNNKQLSLTQNTENTATLNF